MSKNFLSPLNELKLLLFNLSNELDETDYNFILDQAIYELTHGTDGDFDQRRAHLHLVNPDRNEDSRGDSLKKDSNIGKVLFFKHEIPNPGQYV